VLVRGEEPDRGIIGVCAKAQEAVVGSSKANPLVVEEDNDLPHLGVPGQAHRPVILR